MRVSEHFNLGKSQPELPFVDVDISSDLRVYIDPRALLLDTSDWSREAASLVQNFFRTVLEAIRDGDAKRGRGLLLELREPNETHLGQSRGLPRGHALGIESSGDLYDALATSRAAQTGLLEDLEDTILMIPGIRYDIVSDITTNLIRKSLIEFTQRVAGIYGIALEPDVASGSLWDPVQKIWYHEHTSLPIAGGRKLLLVPKAIVRKQLNYSPDEYFSQYILEYLRDQELSDPRSALVQVLKNGHMKVTKKELKKKYGSGKLAAIALTQQHPEVLEQYRKHKRKHISPPLSHSELAGVEGTDTPDFQKLLDEVRAIPPGPESATKYHHAVEALLSAVMYPDLAFGTVEFPIHEKRKRIDIVYSNMAEAGFFKWLATNYTSALIMVECKNYSKELKNPELDQISGRFGPSRGKVGFLVHRGFNDKAELWKRCLDTMHDDRGYIIPLDDDDLVEIVKERAALGWDGSHKYLRGLFMQLIGN